MAGYYKPEYQCPFYIRGRMRGVRCEGGEILLPDEAAARDHVNNFCANEFGWRKCSLTITLQKYYERMENENGKSSEGSQRK